MLALLRLLGWKDVFYGALGFTLVIAFGLYTLHEREVGEAHEAAAVEAQTKKLQADTDRQTAELKAKAQMEHDAYEKEIAALSNQPVLEPVRLCHAAGSRPIVPPTGAAHPGDAATGAGAGAVQPVPARDNSSGQSGEGPDISSMLRLLALRADSTSATLREFQARE